MKLARLSLAALAVALSAGTAQAQLMRLVPQPVVCADPTPAQCHDPSYFMTVCGQAELAKTRVDPNHICNTTLRNDAPALAAALPQRVVLGASTVDAAHQVTPPPAPASARMDPHAQAAKFLNGGTSTYIYRALSPNRAVAAGAIVVDANLVALDPNIPPPPPEAVYSCEEYAREKYWDVSLFEDQAKALGEDYRAIYNVAYGPLDRRESFGSRGSQAFVQRGTDTSVRGRDLRLMNPAWGGAQAKNAYFEVNVANPASTAFPGAPVGLEQLLGSPLSMKGVVLADPAFAPILAAGRTSKIESFAWHKNQSLALAGQLDELLNGLEGQKASFRELLRRRIDLVEKTRKDLIGKWQRETQLAAADCSAAWNVVGHVAPDNRDDAELQADATCDTAFGQRDSRVRAAWNSASARLNALDASIEAGLRTANAQGCLNTGAVTICDWSPKAFVDRINQLYVPNREADYKACLSYTGNQFGANLVNPPGMPLGDYRRNTIALDDYIARRKAQVQAALRPLSGALNPASGDVPAHVGEMSADNLQLGNADFNAAASYLFAWRFWGLGNVLCNVNAKLEGAFSATATAFGRTKNLISASAYADYGVVRTNLTILDQSLVNVNQNLLQEEYQLARSDRQTTNNDIINPRPSMWFSILGVPVKVSAGMAGTLGLEYAANLQVHRGNVNNSCNDVSVELDGLFAPYAKVDLNADAAADFVVIAAGIKVDLTLVQARLPLGVNVVLKAAQGAIAGLSLKIKTTLDLALRTLDGRLALFGRIGICPFCETAEKTIFSWNGIERKLPLFNREVLIALADIRAWFNNPTKI